MCLLGVVVASVLWTSGGWPGKEGKTGTANRRERSARESSSWRGILLFEMGDWMADWRGRGGGEQTIACNAEYCWGKKRSCKGKGNTEATPTGEPPPLGYSRNVSYMAPDRQNQRFQCPKGRFTPTRGGFVNCENTGALLPSP